MRAPKTLVQEAAGDNIRAPKFSSHICSKIYQRTYSTRQQTFPSINKVNHLTFTYTYVMLSRAAFRTARASNHITRMPARSPATSLLRTTSSYLRTNTSSPWISALPFSLSRSYSDAAQAKPTEEGTPAKDDQSAQSGEVETLKKDLEAKNKEVVDLKVCN
jgi:hypothetical protein